MEGEARGEEEEGVEAVRGEEGVEGPGAEEAAERAGGGGDGEQRGEREEREDPLLEVLREGVPRAGGGHGWMDRRFVSCCGGGKGTKKKKGKICVPAGEYGNGRSCGVGLGVDRRSWLVNSYCS